MSYLNARYYDGVRGQFLGQDPAFLDIGSADFKQKYERPLQVHLRNPQSLNSYSYGLNNPVINKDPEGEIVQFITGALTVYSIFDVLIDNYHYNNTRKYPDQYSQKEKDEALNNLKMNYLSFGVSSVLRKPKDLLMDGVLAGSDYIKQFSNIESSNGSKSSTNSSKSQNSTSQSKSSSGKSSSGKNSNNKYQATSMQLIKAQKALDKGDYNGATKALKKASKSLNKKNR